MPLGSCTYREAGGRAVLARRLLVVGGPGTGKTHFLREFGCWGWVGHADDHAVRVPWAWQPSGVTAVLREALDRRLVDGSDNQPAYAIEGVAFTRALLRGLLGADPLRPTLIVWLRGARRDGMTAKAQQLRHRLDAGLALYFAAHTDIPAIVVTHTKETT